MTRKPTAKKNPRKADSAPASQVLQLKITLRYLEPPIWRRLLVPDRMSLGDLHNLIHCAMGWGGGHLHGFRLPAPRGGPPARTFGEDGEDEDTTRIGELLVRPRQVLLYEYDFGDGWLHEILFEKILPPDPAQSYPVCLGGARACPPDDCGGPPGYDQLIEALKKPKVRANRELLEWCGEWDPEAFDLESLNRSLRRRR